MTIGCAVSRNPMSASAPITLRGPNSSARLPLSLPKQLFELCLLCRLKLEQPRIFEKRQ